MIYFYLIIILMGIALTLGFIFDFLGFKMIKGGINERPSCRNPFEKVYNITTVKF